MQAGMLTLPVGVSKVMVSTAASGDTRPYVGTRDIVMFPSVVDVAGVNRISRQIFRCWSYLRYGGKWKEEVKNEVYT